MTARGFQLQGESSLCRGVLIGIILGTFAIFSGWILRLYNYPSLISIILYLIGGLLFVLGFWLSHRKVTFSRYHHESWSWNDLIPSALFILAGLAWFLLNKTPAASSLAYSPYPTIKSPNVQWLGLILSLLPLVPGLFYRDD